MTRSTQLTHAGTAESKTRAAARALPEPESMKFRTFEDNGGDYRWTIVTASDKRLVQSESFAGGCGS